MSLKPWLEAQSFLRLSSASVAGACACAYRGRETQGVREPLLHVLDERSLLIPDYRGNNLFNTVSNLSEHDPIALLLADFERQRTVTIQGRAQLMAAQKTTGMARSSPSGLRLSGWAAPPRSGSSQAWLLSISEQIRFQRFTGKR